jgi:hypothetical protein
MIKNIRGHTLSEDEVAAISYFLAITNLYMTTAASSRVAGTTQEAQHLLPEGSSGCKVNI